MARPGDGKKRSETRQKTESVQKRVTPEEKAEFEERALAAGFACGRDYHAAFVLGEIEIDARADRDLREILGHVGRMWSSLDQIASAIAAERPRGIGPDEARILFDIRAGLAETRKAIRQGLKR